MSTETTDTTTETPDTEPETPDTTTDAPDTEETPEWTPPDKGAWDKLEAKAAKAAERDKLLREAQAKIKKLENPDAAPEPTEADKLRSGMKRTAARAVLAGAGIADKADQAVILEALSLEGVEIGDDGEADTDALEDRLSELRRIFGGQQTPTKRAPRVDTRDRGGRAPAPTDPDKARRLAFLAGR